MNHDYLIAFSLYFTILLVIGLLANRKQTSSADFIMGNRSLNFWLVALSAHASDMSAWLFMGLPMSVFLLGVPQAWIVAGLVTGMYLNWHWIAPKIRTETEKYNCYTLSSFFEKRFADRTGVLRLISAVVLVLFMTHYLSAGMIGVGILLESLFNLNYYAGLAIAMCVVVAYTYMGGFVAIAWTDLFQGLFLLLMIISVPVVAYLHIDGYESIIAAAAKKDISLNLYPENDFIGVLTMVLLAASWGIGYFGMPHVVTKFMSIKHTSDLKKSKWFGMAWQVIVLSGSLAVGLIAIAFFADGLASPQMVFVDMVRALFHPFIAGFILCAVLAASLSTMDSQILVCASVISEDLYSPYFSKIRLVNKLTVSRLSVVGISLFALLLSINKSTTIMETVSYSWTGLGSAFGPLVIASLYSKKTTDYGAIAGVLSGGLMAMIWPHINSYLIIYTIPAMIPSFLFSFVMIGIVSAVTQKQPEKVRHTQTSDLFEVNN